MATSSLTQSPAGRKVRHTQEESSFACHWKKLVTVFDEKAFSARRSF
jgi:hypothetical protein